MRAALGAAVRDADGNLTDVATYEVAVGVRATPLARTVTPYLAKLRASTPEFGVEWQFSERAAPYHELPTLVLHGVVRYLGDTDIVAASRVCRAWHHRLLQLPQVVEMFALKQQAAADALQRRAEALARQRVRAVWQDTAGR